MENEHKYVIEELTSLKIAWRNIADSPINNAISVGTKKQAVIRVAELQSAIEVLTKAGEK